MATRFFILVFALAFCSATGGFEFGFELLITKLEMLEHKLLKLDFIEQQLSKITQLDIIQQKLSNIEKTMEKQTKNVFRSCSEEPSKMSGKYRLQPDANELPFVGFCEQEEHGGGWLVIQHRFDGSVNFYRNWTEYKKGFGKIDGEFWIGLERLHKLTKNKPLTLMVEIEDYDGNYGYSIYDSFEIGDETEKYRLESLGEHTGSIGDSMIFNKGQRFTTRDSDSFFGNCAQEEAGAWWYGYCGHTNPNGPFHKQAEWKKIYWYDHRNGVELKFFRMLIK